MPTFISKDGQWFPAKEKAVHRETGELYEGPDREATKFIAQETGGNQDWIGTPVIEDTQIAELARHHNLTVPEYLEKNKPTPKQQALKIEADAKVADHKPVAPKPGVSTTDGGFFEKDVVKEFAQKKG